MLTTIPHQYPNGLTGWSAVIHDMGSLTTSHDSAPSLTNRRAASTALTDDQLLVLLQSIDPTTMRLPAGFKQFARAVELAHNIGTVS